MTSRWLTDAERDEARFGLRCGDVGGAPCCTTVKGLDHGFDLDFFLVSQIYSLMHHGHAGAATAFCDQAAVEAGGSLAEMERAAEAGMGVINATPFNAGIGVTGAIDGATQGEHAMPRVRELPRGSQSDAGVRSSDRHS